MKKTAFTFIIAFVANVSLINAQEKDSIIHFDKGSNKPFIIENKAYTFRERHNIFKNEESLRLLKSANGNLIGGQILAGVGGGLLGATLSDFLLSKRENFTDEQWSQKKTIRAIFLGSGVALIGIAIPVSRNSIKKIERAVDIENDARKDRANKTSSTLEIGARANAVTLRYRF